MSRSPKRKNNHYVPKYYLKRFRSKSDRQIGLYNLNSGAQTDEAPIKSQCARSYFYSKNPIFEDRLSALEAKQTLLLERIISQNHAPIQGTSDRQMLSAGIALQEGRTVSSAMQADRLADQFGRAMLRRSLESEGKFELVEALSR